MHMLFLRGCQPTSQTQLLQLTVHPIRDSLSITKLFSVPPFDTVLLYFVGSVGVSLLTHNDNTLILKRAVKKLTVVFWP